VRSGSGLLPATFSFEIRLFAGDVLIEEAFRLDRGQPLQESDDGLWQSTDRARRSGPCFRRDDDVERQSRTDQKMRSPEMIRSSETLNKGAD
jgi:hypothetical protein